MWNVTVYFCFSEGAYVFKNEGRGGGFGSDKQPVVTNTKKIILAAAHNPHPPRNRFLEINILGNSCGTWPVAFRGGGGMHLKKKGEEGVW